MPIYYLETDHNHNSVVSNGLELLRLTVIEYTMSHSVIDTSLTAISVESDHNSHLQIFCAK